jgi:hypothetical protein
MKEHRLRLIIRRHRAIRLEMVLNPSGPEDLSSLCTVGLRPGLGSL